jgi:integrase/recombinase XerC
MDLIAEYVAHLGDLNRSPRTVTEYEQILRRLDRTLPSGLIGSTAGELKDGINTKRRGPHSRRLITTTVCGFFRWAADPPDDEPWIDFNPATHLPLAPRPKPRPKPVASDQLARVLAEAAEPYRTWFMLAAYAGLRCIEISRIHREHITEQEVWVRKGKGDRERYVPTHPALWRAVEQLPPGPVALDPRGSFDVLDERMIAQRGGRRLKPLIPGGSMHRLRHWFGTEAYRVSRDPFAVRDLMGHADVSSTQMYVEIVDGQRSAAVAALPDLT